MASSLLFYDESVGIREANPFTSSLDKFYQTNFKYCFPGLLDGRLLPEAVPLPEVRRRDGADDGASVQVGRNISGNLFARVNPNVYYRSLPAGQRMAFPMALLEACTPGLQPGVPKPAFNKVYRSAKKDCSMQPLVDIGGGNGFKLAFAHKYHGTVVDGADRYFGPHAIVIDKIPKPAHMLEEHEAQEGMVFRQQDLNACPVFDSPENFLVISVNALTNYTPKFVALLRDKDSYNLVPDIEHLKALQISVPIEGGKVKTKLSVGMHQEYDHGLILESMPFLPKGCGHGIFVTLAPRFLSVLPQCTFLEGSRSFYWYAPESIKRYSQEPHHSFPGPYKLKVDGIPGAINISYDKVEVQVGGAGFSYVTADDHQCGVPVMLEGEVVYPSGDDEAVPEFHPHRLFLGGRPCGYSTLCKFLETNAPWLGFLPDININKLELFDDLNEAFKADHACTFSDGVVSLADNRHVAAKVIETVDVSTRELEVSGSLMSIVRDHVAPRKLVVSNWPGYKRNRSAIHECHVIIRPNEVEIMAFRGRKDKAKGNAIGRVLSMLPNPDVNYKDKRLLQIKDNIALDVSCLFEISSDFGEDRETL